MPTDERQPVGSIDGVHCPRCGEPSARRFPGNAERVRPEPSPPGYTVPCYCPGCGVTWDEVYRFAGVVDRPR